MVKYIALGMLVSFNSFAYFKMHNRIVNNEFKICIIGDTGTGSKTHHEMANHLAKENCNQVRLVGDVIYPSGLKSDSDMEYFEKFYIPFKPVIKGQTNPLFHIVVGNHDYKQDEYVWAKLHNKFHYLFSPALQFVETYHQGEICFFNIDTTAVQNFKIRRAYKQFRWLRKQIAGHKTCKIKLAFGHHPFRSSGYHGDADYLLKYFLKHTIIGEVDAYFAGHEHQISHEGSREGTQLFITGSFSKTRKIEEQAVFASDKNGYIVLKINQTPEEYFLDLDFKALNKGQLETVYQYQLVK